MFKVVPAGFVPLQDKGYLIDIAQLPDAASLDRTDAVIHRMGKIAAGHAGRAIAVQFPGLSVNDFTASPSAGIQFSHLKDFDRAHRRKDLSGHGHRR